MARSLTARSLYDAHLSKVIVENHVNLGVSFEVLKDIQNAQRQHYDEVVRVVRHYLNDGADVTVKSIITPNNVNRLEEMVEELRRLFPQVKKYKLQMVEDPVEFADRERMRRFYADFTRNFCCRAARNRHEIDCERQAYRRLEIHFVVETIGRHALYRRYGRLPNQR